jgi:hypothetical protein
MPMPASKEAFAMMRVFGFLGMVVALWVVLQLYQKNYASQMGSGDAGARSRPITEDVRDRVTAANRMGEDRLARQLGSD